MKLKKFNYKLCKLNNLGKEDLTTAGFTTHSLEEIILDYGKKIWVFPDAELPPAGVNIIPGHESVIVANTTNQSAEIKITLLFEDKAPVSFFTEVEAQRVRCLRTNRESDFGAHTAAPCEQYAIVLESSVPVVAQYGRAEPRAVSFYTTPGYCE